MRAVVGVLIALLVGLLTPIIFLANGGAFIVDGQTIRKEVVAPPPSAPPRGANTGPRRPTASGLPPGSSSSDEPVGQPQSTPAPAARTAALPPPPLDTSNSYGIGKLFVIVMPK
jgi:hypothetical protein